MMNETVKKTVKARIYKAMVWVGEQPGERITIEAKPSGEASKSLTEKYGPDAVMSLYNEEDASRPRSKSNRD